MAIIVYPDGEVKVEFVSARSHPGTPGAGTGRPAIVVHEWEPPREVRE